MFVAALFLYADAQAYGTAAIFGLIQDLGLYTILVLDGAVVVDISRYSMAAGIYFLGAVAVSKKHPVVSLSSPRLQLHSCVKCFVKPLSLQGTYPLLLLAQRLPVGKFLGGFMVFIGTLALLTVTCHNYAGILVLR